MGILLALYSKDTCIHMMLRVGYQTSEYLSENYVEKGNPESLGPNLEPKYTL